MDHVQGDAPNSSYTPEQDVRARRRFVLFFRGASPYIEGHRGRTFVVLIPGEVVGHKPLLYPLLEDVALLHGAAQLLPPPPWHNECLPVVAQTWSSLRDAE